MSIAPLLAALSALKQALREPDVLGFRETLTVMLPYEAGRRFEVWAARNLSVIGGAPELRTVDEDGPAPRRELVIEAIAVISWPLKLIALESGRIVPEPVVASAPRVVAHTNLDQTYPGYINFTREDDGTVSVYLRGDPSKFEGSYICGYAADKWKPGRCTPGDDRCNNYCNMAPQKGPMQDHPADATQIREGATTKLTLSAADFDALIAAARPERVGT